MACLEFRALLNDQKATDKKSFKVTHWNTVAPWGDGHAVFPHRENASDEMSYETALFACLWEICKTEHMFFTFWVEKIYWSKEELIKSKNAKNYYPSQSCAGDIFPVVHIAELIAGNSQGLQTVHLLSRSKCEKTSYEILFMTSVCTCAHTCVPFIAAVNVPVILVASEASSCLFSICTMNFSTALVWRQKKKKKKILCMSSFLSWQTPPPAKKVCFSNSHKSSDIQA